MKENSVRKTGGITLLEGFGQLPLSGIHLKIWAVCTCGFVLDSLDLYIIAFALPLIIKDWSISSSLVGIIASGAMWGMGLGSYFWGILSDRIGRRKSLQGVVLIFSLMTGLGAFAWNGISLFLFRFLSGLGLGGIQPVLNAILAELSPSQYRGRAIASSLVLWPLGGMLGAFIALNLTPIWGWKALFVVGALPIVLVFVIAKIVPESPYYLIDRGQKQEALEVFRWMEKKINLPEAEINMSANPEPHEKVSLKELFSAALIKKTILTSFLWFFHALPYYGIMLWLPTLMTKYYNMPQAEAYKAMLLFTGIGMVGRFIGMSVIDFVGRRPIMITCGIGAAMGFLSYNFISNTTQFWVVAAFTAIFYEAMYTGLSPYTAELFPTRFRSTGFGLAAAMGRVGASMAPMFIGFVVDISLPAIFITFATMQLILVLGVVLSGFETKGKSLDEISA